MASLSLEQLTKDFPGGVRALDGFSLDVSDGEFVVVVGPSGSGKSTLLRLVAGLERPTKGRVRLGDMVVNNLPPRRRDVAMAFQNPALYPHLSVYQNLGFPLKMRRRAASTVDERVRSIAEQLGIAPLLERKPAAISGGERQRVALGRVLVREAECNLFDEPLAHLDRPLVEQLQAALLETHRRRPTTSLFVTHDQQEALVLGQRVVVLSAGQMQQVAPPREIYDRPANRFVAGFFGSPPMNFFDGILAANDGNLEFVSGKIRMRVTGNPPALVGRVGTPLVAGLRPESICLAHERHETAIPSLDGQDLFAAIIRSVEFLGDRSFARLETTDGHPLIARFRGETRPINSPQKFAIDTRGIHFFESGPVGKRL